MVDYLSEVLNAVGLESKRIKMAYCSAAEGQKYQRTATEFDKEIKEMGPSPIKPKPEEKQPKKQAEKQPEEKQSDKKAEEIQPEEKQPDKKAEKKKKK